MIKKSYIYEDGQWDSAIDGSLDSKNTLVICFGSTNFDDIKDDLAGYGVDFEYEFKDFHDRCIKTDKGWTISMGRGLDIFEKYNTYSVEMSCQDKRKCKDFMVSFIKG